MREWWTLPVGTTQAEFEEALDATTGEVRQSLQAQVEQLFVECENAEPQPDVFIVSPEQFITEFEGY